MTKPSHEYCEECNCWNGNIGNCMKICSVPMNIIEEWEKYHTIGTVEECRSAVEKQKAKKPIMIASTKKDGKVGRCPCCGSIIGEGMIWCDDCGQKLDWGDEE